MRLLLDSEPREKAAIGRELRERIVEHFSVASLVSNTEQALFGLFGRAPA